MTQQRRSIPFVAAVLTAVVGVTCASGWFARTAWAADPEVRVAVAVQDARGSEGASSEVLNGWMQRIEQALAGSNITVVDRFQVTVDVADRSGSESSLRAWAVEAGADALVLARVSGLADRASVDLRVLPGREGPALTRRVLPVEPTVDLVTILERSARIARTELLAWDPNETLPTLANPESSGASSVIAPADLLRVAQVSVSGNMRIDADAIRAVASTQRGEVFSRRQIADDVRRIYELGFFRDVQVVADQVGEGVQIQFVVDENPIIRRVSLSGNENVDASDIRDKLTIAVGATIDYPLLIENQERIQAFYQSKGYYTAEARYAVEPLDDGAVQINYDVKEGKLLRLRDVEFVGNEFMDEDDLMEDFQTKPWGLFSFITRFWDNSGMYAEPIFYQDLEKAQRKYLDSGFIRARISDPEVEFNEKGLRVKVRVDEGPQFRVGEIDVAGDETMARDELSNLVQLKPGDIFNRSMLSDDVERLRLYYSDLGYYKAEVLPRTEVDPDTLTVRCVFEAEKGDLFFVDKIAVQGNTRTRDDVVRRELSLVEGELFSEAALRRSRARVQRLGFFEEVTVESRAVSDDRVAIDVGVVERPTGSFSFGAGFGSTDGFLLNGSIRQDNLFGKGYGLNLQADLGSRNQRASLNFTNPFFRGTAASLGTGLNFSSIEFEDFEQSVSAFSLDLSYPLDEGETRIGTGYLFSDQNIDSEFNRGVASLLQREEFGGRSTTSSLALTGVRDTRDDPRFTRSGQNSGFTFEVAGLGGVNKFLRLEARTTRYMPFNLLGLDSTFVFNSRAGYALPLNNVSDFDLPDCDSAGCAAALVGNPNVRVLSDIDDDLELPLSERFILGGVGAFQVRGFETRSLGPRRARLRQVVRDGVALNAFTPINRNAACDDPSTRAALADDACNDLDDSDIDDFDDLDLTDVVGGNKMFLANFELRVPVSEDFGVTGIWFFDAGNAFAEDESFNPADLRLGTGLGAEWLSPFGPLVLYLGIPLDRLEDEKSAVFEFSLGGSSF